MFNKIRNHFKNNVLIYGTFICGLIIISIIYYLQSVSPLGKNSLLTIDFFHQYGPMLGELYDRIKSGTNLIYSFSMGMGLPFIRNFLNYLSSPFNLIIFLFSRDSLLTSFSVIIGLKAVFSSVSLVCFLKNKFENKIYFIPLALLYGFSAYFTAYYWNIMWLDGMVFLPIIILGIENMINKNKYMLYIVSLAVMLVANYFIGYMICIFSVIYFIGYLLSQTKNLSIKLFLKKSLKFAGASLLAGGIVAVMLIPLFLGLSSISATSDLWPTSQYYAFTIWEYFANHFTGVGSTVFSSGASNAPNISTGVLTVSLTLLFLINPKINVKIKCFYIGLILFFILSFFYAPLDFIWHAFHVPNDLPYRYSFLYSFVLIIISAYSIYNIKENKVRYVIGIYLLTVVFISLLYFLDYKNIESEIIILNFILITVYFIIYLIYKNIPVIKNYVILLFILTCAVECIICTNHNWNILQYVDDFYQDYYPTRTAINYIDSSEEDLMYRIDRTNIHTFNDPSWYNYYGQTTFSSMAYENLAVLQNYLGMPGNNINSYYYKQNTPIYDLMFNIKYFIGDTWDIKRYTLYYNQNDVIVFKSNYNAGLMYAVDKDIKLWNYINEDPLKIQNDFIEKTVLVDNVLLEMEPLATDYLIDSNRKFVKYTFKNPGDNMYFYAGNSDIDFMIINESLYYIEENIDYYKKADEEVKVFDYKKHKEKHIINTRTDEEFFTVYVGYNNYQYDSLYAYTIDDEKYIQAANILENNEVLISEFNEYNIIGFIESQKDATIYTSIPYDDGWSVKINGKTVETFKIGNSLLGFDINQGQNNIELNYRSKGIIVGGIISLVSIFICLFLSSQKKIKNLK